MANRGLWVTVGGVAAVGAAAGIGLWLAKSAAGGGGGGNCTSGQFKCASGKCCPDGDSCANADGSCPSGSSPDGSNPGCCKNACPSSCSADGDCSACGPDFVCESGQCTKQLPAILQVGNLAPSIPETFTYSETCCVFVFVPSCKKCLLSGNGWSGGTTSTSVSVKDSSGRGVPGVLLNFAVNGSGFSWSAVSDGVTYRSDPVPTGLDGTVEVILSGTAPPGTLGDPNDAGYPCSICGGNSDSGTRAAQLGNLVVSSPTFPGLGQGVLVVGAEVLFHGLPNELGGCACV